MRPLSPLDFPPAHAARAVEYQAEIELRAGLLERSFGGRDADEKVHLGGSSRGAFSFKGRTSRFNLPVLLIRFLLFFRGFQSKSALEYLQQPVE